jgi:hypothetical protein
MNHIYTARDYVPWNSSFKIQKAMPDGVRWRSAICFNNDLNFGTRPGFPLRRAWKWSIISAVVALPWIDAPADK